VISFFLHREDGRVGRQDRRPAVLYCGVLKTATVTTGADDGLLEAVAGVVAFRPVDPSAPTEITWLPCGDHEAGVVDLAHRSCLRKLAEHVERGCGSVCSLPSAAIRVALAERKSSAVLDRSMTERCSICSSSESSGLSRQLPRVGE
jgi:hypothetical protein